MNLKAKLILSFIVMILFSAILTAVNIYDISVISRQAEYQSDAYVPEVAAADKLNRALLISDAVFAGYTNSFSDELYAKTLEYFNEMEGYYADMGDVLRAYPARLPLLKAEYPKLGEGIRNYRKATEDLYARSSKLPGLYRGMTESGEIVGRLILNYFQEYRPLAANETERGDKAALNRRFNRYDAGLTILTEVGDARRKMFELMASRDPKRQTLLYTEAKAEMEKIRQAIVEMRAGTKLEIWIQRCDALLKNISDWTNYVDEIHRTTMDTNRLNEEHEAIYQGLLATAMRLSDGGMDSIEASADRTTRLLRASLYMSLTLATAALVVGLIMAFGLTASIVRPVRRIIKELSDASHHVEDSSEALTHSSGVLAENTASQAATLEQTNAALEEIASVTNQNAESAQRTHSITIDTLKRIEDENQAMETMASAMDDINSQADKISDIIKTIEEIAFQTNLLALNAAVEAARAGEAGKGFAVVADEVRNLAGRSAAAAKDTGELIRSTVESVRHGAEVTREVQQGFSEVKNDSQSIGNLVERISLATKDQADGINQISDAVARMDLATQHISKMSTDSADESKNLHEQTEALHTAVGYLIALVNGGKADGAIRPPRPPKRSLLKRLRHKDEAPPMSRRGGEQRAVVAVTSSDLLPME